MDAPQVNKRTEQEFAEKNTERKHDTKCLLPASIRGPITLACCFVVDLTLGITYSSANMSPYTVSYFRNITGDTSVDYSKTVWVDQTSFLVWAGSISMMGILEQRLPPRLFFLAGWILFTASLVGTYWALQKSFISYVIVFGVVQGLGQAILLSPSVKLGLLWFPNRKGLVSGITAAGYGGGAFLWNQIITAWVNPGNSQPDNIIGEQRYFTQQDILNRVPSCFLLLGGILGGTQLICILLVSYPPSKHSESDIGPDKVITIKSDQTIDVDITDEDKKAVTPTILSKENSDSGSGRGETTDKEDLSGQRKDGDSSAVVIQSDALPRSVGVKKGVIDTEIDDKDDDDVDDDMEVEDKMTLRQVVTCGLVWVLFLHNFFVDSGFMLTNQFYKAYAQTFVYDDHLLSLAASTASAFNALARPFWGIFADRFGILPAYLLSLSVLSCTVSTFLFTELGGAVYFFICLCIIFLGISGPYSLMNVIIYNNFGPRNFMFVSGIIYSDGVLVGPALIYLSPILQHNFGWHGIFLLSAAAIFVSVLIIAAIMLNFCNLLNPRMQRKLLLPSKRSKGTRPGRKSSDEAA